MPIVEPEVLMDGAHTIEHCYSITEWVLKTVFEELYYQRVALEGMVLKPNMVVPARSEAARLGRAGGGHDRARAVRLRAGGGSRHRLPVGRPVGRGGDRHLDAINRIGGLPWKVTFSYGRALQAAPQKAWSGKSDNVATAQRAFTGRA